MKLVILSLLALAASIQIARSDDSVRVLETCDKYGCTLTITGPKHPCLDSARSKKWEAGYMAAVAIRDCMDKAAERLAVK